VELAEQLAVARARGTEEAADNGPRRCARRGAGARAFPQIALETQDMRSMMRLLRRLRDDQRGAQVMEYALVAGLVIVVAIVALAAFGGKVLARWQTVNTAL